jgi:hypothetical protein
MHAQSRQHVARGSGSQQDPVARNQATAVPNGSGQPKVPLVGHAEDATRVRPDHQQAVGLTDLKFVTDLHLD